MSSSENIPHYEPLTFRYLREARNKPDLSPPCPEREDEFVMRDHPPVRSPDPVEDELVELMEDLRVSLENIEEFLKEKRADARV